MNLDGGLIWEAYAGNEQMGIGLMLILSGWLGMGVAYPFGKTCGLEKIL